MALNSGKEQIDAEQNVHSSNDIPHDSYDASPLHVHDATYLHRSPRPLAQALPKLPNRYIKALTQPSVATFAEDMGKASWSVVWVQLLGWAFIDGVLGLLVNLISPLPVKAVTSSSSFSSQIFTWSTSIGLIVVVPILFFLIMGLVYLFARAFGGRGTFLEQCNSSLYIDAPAGILSKLLALIPIVGRILNSVLSIYAIVLQVFVIMAVHRLSRARAIAAIVIPLLLISVPAGIVFLIIRK